MSHWFYLNFLNKPLALAAKINRFVIICIELRHFFKIFAIRSPLSVKARAYKTCHQYIKGRFMSFIKSSQANNHIIKPFIAIIFFIISFISPVLAETLRIEVNKASILKLTQTPTTIIIGNPALADVTPQENNILVLVGKASGRTNIIILDDAGEVMHNYDIAVQEEQDGNLTLYKAGKQWSYSCAPFCERVINPNDDKDAFATNLGQVAAKVAQMNSAAKEAASAIDSEFGSTTSDNAAGGGAGSDGAAAGNADDAYAEEQLQTFTILPPQK